MKIKKLTRPNPPPKPTTATFFSWGSSHSDSPDGARIGGYRLIRGPDGELVGLVDKPGKP